MSIQLSKRKILKKYCTKEKKINERALDCRIFENNTYKTTNKLKTPYFFS